MGQTSALQWEDSYDIDIAVDNMTGADFAQLVNNRLAASPPQQEFKHFVQPLYAKNEDAKKSTAHASRP